MNFLALQCPQCGGSLPRAARWRMVHCPFCDAVVTRCDDVVQAMDFHQAWLRTRVVTDSDQRIVRMATATFQVIKGIGSGDRAEVLLADRLDAHRERVILRLARVDGQPIGLEQEFAQLSALQALDGPGAAYFSQRLPAPVCKGVCADTGRIVTVMRQIPGCWGAMADVVSFQRQGVDPHHAVWMWRRILDTLAYIHGNGWIHGYVHPGHVLLQPFDHGAFLIGWERARRSTSAADRASDLSRAAWTIRAILHGQAAGEPGVGPRTPINVESLLRRASEDPDWCGKQGAAGIDQALVQAARADFGPPRFIHFDPQAPGT